LMKLKAFLEYGQDSRASAAHTAVLFV